MFVALRFHGLKPMAIQGVPFQGMCVHILHLCCRHIKVLPYCGGVHRVDMEHMPGVQRPRIWVMLRAGAWERDTIRRSLSVQFVERVAVPGDAGCRIALTEDGKD